MNFNVDDITTLQSNLIIQWKKSGISFQQKDFLKLVEENLAFNYQLWHAEDRARRDDMGYEFVYRAKREIDAHNQQRNNRMEDMDEWLYHALKPAAASVFCPMHSETPGMMIDRLAILALKAYHMKEQSMRKETSIEHQKTCLNKLIVIEAQLTQLTNCLKIFLDEVGKKTRTFKIYHQFKMYNDPSLNPELYLVD